MQENAEAEKLSLEKSKVAASSVAAAAFLTLIKFVAGIYTGSLGILAEAMHSLLDLGATIITLVAVKISDKPPDREHNYGHGKIESFSAFVETLLLFVTCAYIVYEAIQKLTGNKYDLNLNVWAYLVMIVSIIVDLGRSTALRRVALKSHSQALEADALHFSTDIWGSGVVLAGLFFVKIGFPQADPIAALGVAIFVIITSVRLAKRTIDILIDKAPEGFLSRLITSVEDVDGVLGVKNMRVRRSGFKTFVDTTVSVDKNLPFDEAHDILNGVEEAIGKILPNPDIVVHPDPGEPPEGDMAAFIETISKEHGVGVRNIHLDYRKKNNNVEFNLKCDDNKTLSDALKVIRDLEAGIRKQFPGVGRIEIHLDQLQDEADSILKIRGAHNPLEEKIIAIINNIPGVIDCRNIILTERGERYHVDIYCHFKGDLSLKGTKEVAGYIAKFLTTEFPQIENVHIHVEPE